MVELASERTWRFTISRTQRSSCRTDMAAGIEMRNTPPTGRAATVRCRRTLRTTSIFTGTPPCSTTRTAGRSMSIPGRGSKSLTESHSLDGTVAATAAWSMISIRSPAVHRRRRRRSPTGRPDSPGRGCRGRAPRSSDRMSPPCVMTSTRAPGFAFAMRSSAPVARFATSPSSSHPSGWPPLASARRPTALDLVDREPRPLADVALREIGLDLHGRCRAPQR